MNYEGCKEEREEIERDQRGRQITIGAERKRTKREREEEEEEEECERIKYIKGK